MKGGARVAAVVSGALLVPAVVGWWSVAATRQQRDVPMPSDDARATEVVSTFLDALDARDCATARRMLSGESALGTTWCADVASLGVVSIGDPVELRRGRVRVPVTVDLAWRWLRDDESVPAGRVQWGYELDRYGPGFPWRIVEEGAA